VEAIQIVSSIATLSAETLILKEGLEIYAVMKASEVRGGINE